VTAFELIQPEETPMDAAPSPKHGPLITMGPMTTGAQQQLKPGSPPPDPVPELFPFPPDAVPELFPLPPDEVPELFPLPP
jgi:hypothetical protein